MEASKIMDSLQNGVKTLSAALAAGEIVDTDSIGFNIGADGQVTLTKGGQVLAICANATDADAAKRWLDALTADIEAKRAEEAEAIKKSAKNAKGELTRKQKELADAQKKAEKQAEAVAEAEADAEEDEDEEDDALDEDGDAKKPATKKPAPKSHDYKKDVERLTSDVEKAQEKVEKTSAALKRLEDEGKVDEKTENALAAARIMADQIGGYIEKACKEPKFAEAAKQEWKSLPRLIKYVYDKAHDLVLNGRGASACCVHETVVYNWIRDYFFLDDKAEVEKEKAEAEKAAKRKEYSDAKSKADAAKRDATTLRKRANEAKKQADEEADPIKQAALLAEYESKNAEADAKLEESKKLYAALPENPDPEKEKKGSEKKSTAPKPAAETAATAKPAKAKKPEKVEEDLPPLQMTLFDLLGA